MNFALKTHGEKDMKTTDSNVLVLLPAYNVSETIGDILNQLKGYTVLVVDDGSVDETAKILSNYEVLTLHHAENMGLSNAIRTGINYAINNGFDSVITIDADGQHDPYYINSFIEMLKTHDLVCGNRFNSLHGIPSSKIASNTFASALLTHLFNVYIPDASCGYKGFRVSHELVDYIESSTDYSIVFDILLYAFQQKMNIGLVNMEAVYYPSILWSTRIIELNSLLHAINRSIPFDSICNLIQEKSNESCSFDVNVCDINFSFYYLSDFRSYLIQADYDSISTFHNKMRNEKNAVKYNNSSV